MKNPISISELDGLGFKELLEKTGCIKRGHTSFYNGLHGNGWVDISAVMKFPAILEKITKLQSELIKEKLPGLNLIISPAVSGSIVGSQVAMHLNIEFAVTLGKGQDVIFHRRYNPSSEQSVCFVEDIIFSGTDVEANIEFLKNKGFKDIYVCCWMNRREEIINDVRVFSLIENMFDKYNVDSCPLCINGEVIKYNGVRE